jgi:pyrroloquinoline quinone (PQQ) biosynthesis protein C
MEHLLEVRRSVLQRIQATPGVARVLAGEGTREFYGRYLTNVWHYARHSAIVIGMAGARAVPDDPELAHYLLHHAREELGHEQWALEDLAALGVGREEVEASRPVPSCAAMIGYEYYVAGHANPVGLFGWLYVLEAMGDDLGHLASEQIRAGLGLEGGVKFLAGHGEADEAHTADLTVQIRDNVKPADRPDVHHVADVVAELYTRMFDELSSGA